uniref:Uncharacterized protein n=1 Tax=Rhizophora mucronata TaxID=61149 RepID=A0A2P2PX39_RHIMU
MMMGYSVVVIKEPKVRVCDQKQPEWY